MGTTTFSGPVKAGTISNTTGTTLGTDVKNTGQVTMAQTFSTGTSLAGWSFCCKRYYCSYSSQLSNY